MKRNWIIYAGSALVAVAALSVETARAQENLEELLYSLDVGTRGTVLAVPGKAATDITGYTQKEQDFTASTIPLPPELVQELNAHGQGPSGPILKLVVVTRGSAKVWDCGWNDAGEWECRKVNH